MGTINVVKTIKFVHEFCVVLVKIGTFYSVYGKDAYIISYLFKYKIKVNSSSPHLMANCFYIKYLLFTFL